MLEYTSTVNTNCVCRSSRFHSQAQVVANQEAQAESNEFLVEAKDEQLAAAANTRFANRLKNGFVAAAAASLVQLKAGKCMGYMKQHVCVYMLVLLLRSSCVTWSIDQNQSVYRSVYRPVYRSESISINQHRSVSISIDQHQSESITLYKDTKKARRSL